MIGRFYGLTGLTLTLSPISVGSFKKLVIALDTSANRVILSVLKKEISEMLKFLEDFPVIYGDRELDRAEALLRTKRYKSEEERIELEKKLEGKEKFISKHARSKKLGNVTLSDGAHKLITALVNNRDRAKFFYDNLQYSDESSGLSVFGEKLYLLRKRRPAYILGRLESVYGDNFNSIELNNLRRDVEILVEFLADDQQVSVDSELKIQSDIIKSTVESMGVDYFNSKLDLDLDADSYYKLSEELMNLGLFGFSVYTRNFYEDFIKSASLDSASDLGIYAEETPGLYKITKDLVEVLENFEARNRRSYE